MGKLTRSLKATAQQLDQVKYGINQMQALGDELAENTFRVAEAALRTGYAYAKAEVGEIVAQPLLSTTSQVLDKEKLQGETSWTEASLKARFGSCDAAYQHLRNVHGVKLRSRSWKGVIDAFNGATEDRPLEQRVAQLEETVAQQSRHITSLEEKIRQMEQQLQQLSVLGGQVNKKRQRGK